jgi:superfamily II DNA/RNA helicase
VVFCRTKRGADRITRQLGAAGINAVAIHGDRSQGQRDRALQQFRDGHAAALVATDVAARGIHVDDVAAVIHFDPPGDPKDYVHRSGRTARAGARGVVVSLVTPDLRSDVAGLQRNLGHPKGLDRVNLDALGDPGPRNRSSNPPSNRATRNEARRQDAQPVNGSSNGAVRSTGAARTQDAEPDLDREERRRRNRAGQNRPGQSRPGKPRNGQSRNGSSSRSSSGSGSGSRSGSGARNGSGGGSRNGSGGTSSAGGRRSQGGQRRSASR